MSISDGPERFVLAPPARECPHSLSLDATPAFCSRCLAPSAPCRRVTATAVAVPAPAITADTELVRTAEAATILGVSPSALSSLNHLLYPVTRNSVRFYSRPHLEVLREHPALVALRDKLTSCPTQAERRAKQRRAAKHNILTDDAADPQGCADTAAPSVAFSGDVTTAQETAP